MKVSAEMGHRLTRKQILVGDPMGRRRGKKIKIFREIKLINIEEKKGCSFSPRGLRLHLADAICSIFLQLSS